MRMRIGFAALLACLVFSTTGAAEAQEAQGTAGPAPYVPSRAVGGTHDCARYYPALSERLNESGTVQIGYDVETDGAITHVRVLRSSGVERLDEAAVTCVAQAWRNMPASRDGVPARSPGHVANIQFVLDSPPAPLAAVLPQSASPAAINSPAAPAPDVSNADTGTADMWETLFWIFGSLAVIGWLVRGSRLFVFRRRDCPACAARNRSLVPFTQPDYCSSCGSKFVLPA